MRFTRRQKEIIINIIEAEDFITSKQLADILRISTRTIKTEIKIINSLLFSYDMVIDSKTGSGYKFEIAGEKELADVNQFLEDLEYDRYINIISSIDDRVRFIGVRLLLSNDYIKSQALADEVYVSNSTISQDLKQVKQMFSLFNLRVESKPYKGIKIVGGEISLRNAISFLLFKNKHLSQLAKHFYGDFVFEIIDKIYLGINSLINENKIEYPFYNLYDIAKQIFVSIMRISTNNNLIDFEYVCSDRDIVSLANLVCEVLEETFTITISKSELNRIICLFDTLSITESREDEVKHIGTITRSAIEEISMKHDYSFYLEENAFRTLEFHLIQMIKRSKQEVMIYNPLSNTIVMDYMLSVDFANVLAAKIEEYYDITISLDEFAYLVLYFNIPIHSKSNMRNKTINILFPNNRAEEQMIYEEIKSLFTDIVKDVVIVTREEIKIREFNHLDLIITSNLNLISLLPNYIPKIVSSIDNKTQLIFDVLTQLNNRVQGVFNLSEMLNSNLIVSGVLINTKDEYYETLFNNLCSEMIMDYGEASFLYQNIDKFGQEIGNQIVVVRSQNKFIMPFIHFTIPDEPFFWETNYVKLIIFVNFGDNSIEFRSYLYDKLATLIKSNEINDTVLKNKDSKKLYDIFI